MERSLSILVLEDRQDDAELMIRNLRAAGIAPQWQRVETREQYANALDNPWDVILADYRLPQFDALQAIALLQERGSDIPVIVVTGSISEEVAVECMKHGAADYLLKDRLVRLGPAVRQALEARHVRAQKQEAEDVLRRSEQQLRELNETLERRVAERTAEAEHRAVQLRRLASELTRTEQRERQRIVTILHEHFQQLLAAARFHLRMVQSYDPGAKRWLQRTDRVLEEAIEVSRSLTVELSPPILNYGGLIPALEWLRHWMLDKHDLTVEVVVEPGVPILPKEVQVLLFQAVRELLFNVVKHAEVHRATVQLGRMPDETVRVVVADEGVGFDAAQCSQPKRNGSGFGLFSIRERLQLLGGRLDIDSAPGRGTRMTLVAPIGETAATDA